MSQPNWHVLWGDEGTDEEVPDFFETLAEYAGVPRSNPKWNALWNLAWSRGHAGGIEDIVDQFVEMAELIK